MAQENGGGFDEGKEPRLRLVPASNVVQAVFSSPAETPVAEVVDPNEEDPFGDWCYVVSVSSRCPECDEPHTASRVIGVDGSENGAKWIIANYVHTKNGNLEESIKKSPLMMLDGLERLRLVLDEDGLSAVDNNGCGVSIARRPYGTWIDEA